MREGVAGDGGADPLGQLGRLGDAEAGEDDEELLAAGPVGQLEGAELTADEVGDADEDVVTAAMADRVVDAA